MVLCVIKRIRVPAFALKAQSTVTFSASLLRHCRVFHKNINKSQLILLKIRASDFPEVYSINTLTGKGFISPYHLACFNVAVFRPD